MKIRFIIFKLLILLIISSCRITNNGDNIITDPGSSAFVFYSNSEAFSYNYNLLLKNNYIYSSDGNNRISIYDVLNPIAPSRLHSFSLESGSMPVRHIIADNRNNIYVAAADGGLHIINVSNPAFPQSISYNPDIFATGSAYLDDYLFVTHNNGFKIYYTGSGNQLTEIGSFSYFLNRRPLKVLIKNNWLYIITSHTLDIFDVSNTSNIQLEKTLTFTDVIDIDFVSHYLALITGNNLYFINIFNPMTAYIEKYYVLEWMPALIRFYDNNMFIAWQNLNLSAYRMHSINRIEEIARKHFAQPVNDLTYHQNLLYLSNALNGIQIYYFLY